MISVQNFRVNAMNTVIVFASSQKIRIPKVQSLKNAIPDIVKGTRLNSVNAHISIARKILILYKILK